MALSDPNAPIIMRFWKRVSYTKPTEAWTFEPTGRFQWLQRWLWNRLRALGALKQYQEEAEHYVQLPFGRYTGLTAIQGAFRHAFAAFGNGKPKRILMGPEDFEHMIGRPVDELRAKGVSFSVEARYGEAVRDDLAEFGHRTHVTVYDVPVEIVPHMDGTLVL